MMMKHVYTQITITPVFRYPSTTPASNLLFFNPNSLSPPQTQQLVGIPLPATSAANQGPTSHDISPLHGLVQRVHYNLYNPIDPSGSARETPRAQQGLSLTLSSQQQPGYGSQAQAVSGGSASSGSGVHNRVSGVQSVFLSSKYLKAAQELLDEVVNVNTTGITKSELLAKKGGGGNNHSNSSSKAMGESSVVAGDGSGGGEAGEKHVAELTTAEKQEIQMKKAKLINMLDEVEQRYRQYHHQMQIVTSSFEQAAGIGSAKTYTALALKTISKQFRCLKDAISDQIRAANKNLGEEEDGVGEAAKIEGSRLKRGLPERSVSVLRAWLFEHFLHPYPKDSDKHMLAKQTGLTRSQVSNWFINARVRLWKPMVEEMYLEEIKEQEQNGTSDDKTSKTENHEDSASKSTAPSCQNPGENQKVSLMSISTASTSPLAGNAHQQSRFSLIGSSELEGITQGSPKKPRSNELLQSPTSVPSMNMDMNQSEASNDVSMKFSKDGYSFMGTNTDFMGGLGQYPIGEIGRFDAEQFAPKNLIPNQTMQMGRRLDIDEPNEFGAINPTTPHSSAAYESINLHNRKREQGKCMV
ncbi:hypothetical protein GOBAR_DD01341 [Gossypium barbadense]|nr:hypothetical protein GOBAR_DD01341 [Gossypium barbadense]